MRACTEGKPQRVSGLDSASAAVKCISVHERGSEEPNLLLVCDSRLRAKFSIECQ